ncbi:MAG: methyltransferase [Deferribacteraceae bacterium]|nr:methyltransferase [Deferribacteraceae bacterium]
MSIDSIIFPYLKICQPDSQAGFRFGIDSVILAHFASLKSRDKVIDIGSGSGVLSALLVRMKGAQNVTAVELQPEMYACLAETVRLNAYENVITPINADIRKYKPERSPQAKLCRFSLAICNPPYRKASTGKTSANQVSQTARFDDSLTLEEILRFCRSYVDYGGRFAFCGDADRLVDGLCSCREAGFEPKRLAFLYPDAAKQPRVYFLECVYGAGAELIVEAPIIQNSPQYIDILQGLWR